MYFFLEPDDVYRVVGGNLTTFILGSKSGNERAYRAAQRARAKNTPMSQMANSKGGQDFLDAFDALLRKLNYGEADVEFFNQAPPSERESDWSRFLLSARMKNWAPQTADFTTKLARGSIVCRALWQVNRRSEAIDMIAQLPWAHTDTMQWYLSALRTNEADLSDDWHFPAQTLGLFAFLRMLSIESAERNPSEKAFWSFADLLASRNPDTGNLEAIRYFLDRAKKISGIETNADFYRKAFDLPAEPSTHREAKRFRAGTSIPAHHVCLSVHANLCTKSRLDERSDIALFMLANIASFCQRAFERLRKTSNLTLDPISPFDDYRELQAMPKERLQEALNLETSYVPALTP